MMSDNRYMVDGYKMVRLCPKEIIATNAEIAKEVYAEEVNKGNIELLDPRWYEYSAEDCNEPVELLANQSNKEGE
jgi:hypothetical protein